MIDFTQARRTMVDSQLRTFDVNDIRLLDAIDAVPRERFVLPGSEQLAYSDQELAVSEGADRRFMVTPMVLARMIQALEIDAGDTVLDVACGRGYSSAILSELGAYVTALEADGELVQAARAALSLAGAKRVAVERGDLADGFANSAPYDADPGERRARDASRNPSAAAEKRRTPGLRHGTGPRWTGDSLRPVGRCLGRTDPLRCGGARARGLSAEAGLCVLVFC